jgi:hypothetical protein
MLKIGVVLGLTDSKKSYSMANMNKFLNYILVLIAVISSYFAYASYIQTKNFQISIDRAYHEIELNNAKLQDQQEEDHQFNVRIDLQNKRLSDQDNLIRLQNAQIAELRARTERIKKK